MRALAPRLSAVFSVACALWLASACTEQAVAPEPVVSGEPSASIDDPWLIETAAELGEKLGGVAVSDLLPDTLGNEIVAVGESGRVTLVRYDDSGWSHEMLADFDGEMIQVAAGELNGRLGSEVVAVGMAVGGEDDGGDGLAHLLTRAMDGTWSTVELHRSSALIHAVCVFDADGDGAQEIALAGFAKQLVVLSSGADGWNVMAEVPLAAAGKNLVPHSGGVAVALTDGTVVHTSAANDWKAEVIDRGSAGRARLGSDGERLVIASDDGSLVMLGANGSRADLHRSGQKLRGAVLHNLVPISSGLEAATVGYDGRVIAITFDDGKATEQVIHSEGEALHHLAAGTLASRGDGVWLVTVGYSGRVLVARGPGWAQDAGVDPTK